NALNALTARINEMEKLTADAKTSLISPIQAQATTLNDLRTKIAADASNTVELRADAQSITSSYRVFALVLPRAAIEAAANRAITIADTMTALGGKLQARMASSTSAGATASTTVTAYADFTAKIADARTQAQAAMDEVSSLNPDMGDQTKFQANLT